MADFSADADDRVVINVSGRRYETHAAVLRRLPRTLLGDEQRRAAHWDAKRGEFFFDRCASSFEGVLLTYQTGCDASRPCGVPIGIFLEDLRFFGLSEQAERLAGGGHAAPPVPPPFTAGWRGRLAGVLEQPVITAASLVVTLAAVVAFVVATLPSVRPDEDGLKLSWTSAVILLVVELVCTMLLFVELVLRFLVTSSVRRFVLDPLNVLDLLATVPFFVFFALMVADLVPANATASRVVYWLGILARLLRLFRVFRFVRRTAAGQTLKRTAAAAAPTIGVIFVVWVAAALFFASLLYWLESEVYHGIESIPQAIYWAVITMTTVGYGDIYAMTLIGRLVSALCAYTGYFMVSLPIAVIVTKFAQCSQENCADRAYVKSKNWPSPLQAGNENLPMEEVHPTHVYRSLPSEDRS